MPEPHTLYNHGVFLHSQKRLKSSLECFQKVIDIQMEGKVKVPYKIVLLSHLNIAILYEELHKP